MMDKETLARLLGVDVETLSDESFGSFNEQYEAELDRARTQASKTAASNATKTATERANKELEAKALERAQELLDEMKLSEQEKMNAQLEKERAALEQQRAEFVEETKRTAIEAKLKAANYEGDSLATLTDLFASKGSLEECEASIDTFLEDTTNRINSQVDAIKAELTSAGASSGGMDVGSPGEGVLSESQLISSVYKHAESEGFANTFTNNVDLDAYAIMASEQVSQADV